MPSHLLVIGMNAREPVRAVELGAFAMAHAAHAAELLVDEVGHGPALRGYQLLDETAGHVVHEVAQDAVVAEDLLLVVASLEDRRHVVAQRREVACVRRVARRVVHAHESHQVVAGAQGHEDEALDALAREYPVLVQAAFEDGFHAVEADALAGLQDIQHAPVGRAGKVLQVLLFGRHTGGAAFVGVAGQLPLVVDLEHVGAVALEVLPRLVERKADGVVGVGACQEVAGGVVQEPQLIARLLGACCRGVPAAQGVLEVRADETRACGKQDHAVGALLQRGHLDILVVSWYKGEHEGALPPLVAVLLAEKGIGIGREGVEENGCGSLRPQGAERFAGGFCEEEAELPAKRFLEGCAVGIFEAGEQQRGARLHLDRVRVGHAHLLSLRSLRM